CSPSSQRSCLPCTSAGEAGCSGSAGDSRQPRIPHRLTVPWPHSAPRVERVERGDPGPGRTHNRGPHRVRCLARCEARCRAGYLAVGPRGSDLRGDGGRGGRRGLADQAIHGGEPGDAVERTRPHRRARVAGRAGRGRAPARTGSGGTLAMGFLFPNGFRFPDIPSNFSLTGEPIFTIGPISYTNAHFTMLLVMILLSSFAFFATRNLREQPSGLQNVAEMLVQGLGD